MGLVSLLPFLKALQRSTPDPLANQSNEGSDDAQAPPPEPGQNQPGLGTPSPSLYAATGQQQQQPLPSQTPGNQQASPTPPSNTDSFPKVETPSAEDIANGNYIIEGRRHLLVNGPGQIGLHDYTKIPVIENGKVKRDPKDGKPMYERWGVLGNDGSDKNQQVRDDPRNDQFKGREGSEVWVKVTPEQREALRQGMQYFAQTDENGNFIHPCPVCGDRYGRYDRNSNTFQYNMRFWNPAGPIPSQKGPFWTLGEWKNEPNEHWYQPQEPSK